MIVNMETRLAIRIGTFVPAAHALDFRYPLLDGGVAPTVQAFVGGVTDRETRAAARPRMGVGTDSPRRPSIARHRRRALYFRDGSRPRHRG